MYEVFLKDEAKDKGNFQFYMLLGYAGSGKSVTLKRIAWEASTQLNKICIFYKSNTNLRAEPIIELFNFVKERIYIFIDDIADTLNELDDFIRKIEKEKIPITILGLNFKELLLEISCFFIFLNKSKLLNLNLGILICFFSFSSGIVREEGIEIGRAHV